MPDIVIQGRPISYNSSARSKIAWKAKVALEANDVFDTPLTENDLKVIITYFYTVKPDFDTDNISKPIIDALNTIAYNDDDQITERNVRRRDISGSYIVEGLPPVLRRMFNK